MTSAKPTRVPLSKHDLGDSRLSRIEWIGNGTELVLQFKCPQTGKTLDIAFEWVTALRVDMDFGRYSGQPLVFDAWALPIAGGYSVTIQFGAAPEGSMTFLCDRLREKGSC